MVDTSLISPRVRALLDQATADNVRFIKLGRKSAWWPLARDTKTLRLGFREFDFSLCNRGQWDKAKEAFAATGARTGAGDITRAVNQVRDFFELPESTLWCTIEDGDVWWCFAEPEVVDLYTRDDAAEGKSGARLRHVIDRWCNTDVNGNRLRLDSLTTKITKVASFQETIAKPSGAADLLRLIRGIQSDAHARTSRALNELTEALGNLLDQLHQNDFELLIELIFASSGWKRRRLAVIKRHLISRCFFQRRESIALSRLNLKRAWQHSGSWLRRSTILKATHACFSFIIHRLMHLRMKQPTELRSGIALGSQGKRLMRAS